MKRARKISREGEGEGEGEKEIEERERGRKIHRGGGERPRAANRSAQKAFGGNLLLWIFHQRDKNVFQLEPTPDCLAVEPVVLCGLGCNGRNVVAHLQECN